MKFLHLTLSLEFINLILAHIKNFNDKTKFGMTLRTKGFLESYCLLESYE